MRWKTLLLAVATIASAALLGSGVARADSAQSIVDAGSADAASRGTTAGIAVLDRVAGRYTDNGPTAHQWFGSASLVKLFIADSVLRRARLGQLTLSDADRSSLGLMLRSSDDAAANSFWSRFGANSIVTDVKARYGLNETAPPANPRYWGLTQVTAHDLVTFYDGMLSGRGGLAAADRDFIVDQLRHSTAQGTDGQYQWFGLHDGLPREPVLGIKQGWMCCFSDGYIWRHSTGIVGPDARYVVVVLTRDAGSAGAAHTEASSTRVVQRMYPAGLVPRVQGLIGDLWYQLGGPSSALGLPTSNGEYRLPAGAWEAFQNGAIYWSPPTGAHEVHGLIREAWGRFGWETGFLGYPNTNELPLTGGAVSGFQGGLVYWSPPTGAHEVHGAVLDTYRRLGYERSTLGYPNTDTLPLTGGVVSGFTGGLIYWSPATGAHEVHGPVLDAYRKLAYERGILGYPNTDTLPLTGGVVSGFTGGLIYWSSATGAHEVHGPILDAYRRLGYERSALGYPTSDQVALPGGAVSRFTGGAVYWSSATGAHWLGGALLDAYTAHGADQGTLGYPTSDPHAVDGGTRVDLQHGSLTLTPAGQVVVAEDGAVAARTPAPTPAPTSSAPPAATPSPTPTPTPTTPSASPTATATAGAAPAAGSTP